MKRFAKVLLLILFVSAACVGVWLLLRGLNVDVLNPQGEIALKQRNLIVITSLLSLLVIIPVFVMLITFSLRYNVKNKKQRTYMPDWEGNKTIEGFMWGIPCAIIIVLSVITWQSSHELDPYRHIESNKKALEVQVVSLQWKWLFIYPEQNIATVNALYIPKDTPVNFTLTSDAPMNAFWVPSLGTQVYTMSGMSSKLSLIANSIGEFKGVSSNISGTGFADMNFKVHSVHEDDFNSWVEVARKSQTNLDASNYAKLSEPSTPDAPLTFKITDTGLYDTIVMKYMMPMHASNDHGYSKITKTQTEAVQ